MKQEKLQQIKDSLKFVCGDRDVNKKVKKELMKLYDCFGKAYLEGHRECKQCVMITEFDYFGVFRREPLRVVCKEVCDGTWKTNRKSKQIWVDKGLQLQNGWTIFCSTKKLAKELADKILK